MRKIIFMMSVSLDGFFEGPDRDLGWQVIDEELHSHFNQWLGAAGGFLDGRITHELMAEYWPTADADPAAPTSVREFAGIWRDMPKVIYSRTLQAAGWNAAVVRDVVPAEVTELKAQPGGDLVLGGANLAETFIRLDLIDEYRLYVHPVLIGQGHRPFPSNTTDVRLRLADTRTFASGVVLLRYQRDAAA
jgi:dihydrofolate reductase